jgi:hypothetical protein
MLHEQCVGVERTSVRSPLQERTEARSTFVPLAAEAVATIITGRILEARSMARWPRNYWTTIFTYGAIFVAFPVLCYLAYCFVMGISPFTI